MDNNIVEKIKKNEDNILLIDKPKGITSFDVIRELRKKFGRKKMGHAGTLDPLASGLMLIGVGEGTKKLTGLIGLTKTYIAEIQLGVQTNTGDLEGDVIKEKEIPALSVDKINKALNSMTGEIKLAVPLYSAIKLRGKPLYKYAREGKEIEVPIKTMKIMSASLKGMESDVIIIEFEVGSGTYIRSVAEELGKRLDTVATLKNLRRTSIGDYSIKDAEKLD